VKHESTLVSGSSIYEHKTAKEITTVPFIIVSKEEFGGEYD